MVPFRRWMPVVCSATGADDEMVARLGAAPSMSSSRTRRIAVFLARVTIWGRVEMAACAGFAPAEEAEGNSGGWRTGEPTVRSTSGCSS